MSGRGPPRLHTTQGSLLGTLRHLFCSGFRAHPGLPAACWAGLEVGRGARGDRELRGPCLGSLL